MSSEKTSNSRTGDTWLGFQRRKTVSRYPYNFITAIQNKIKVAVMNSKVFNSQRRKVDKKCESCINLFKGYSNKSIQTDHDSRKTFKCKDLVGTASSEEKTLNQNNKLVRHTKAKRRNKKKKCSHLTKSHIKNVHKLLKVREKLLIDRTKYLLSLFELQKERLKAKGYFKQYMKVNKMQERLLYQLREERLYLKRLLIFNERGQLLLPTKTLGKLACQSALRNSTTKQELCRTQNIPMLRAFDQEYSIKILPNFQTGNICYFDSKGNLFILSKGRNALGYPVNDVPSAGAQLTERCSPYIKHIYETKNHLPMLQADPQSKDENFVAKHNKDPELLSKKSYLKEFNAIWNDICNKQESALEDFTYYTKFLAELFNEDFVVILSRSQSNVLHMQGEDWSLKSVFAARIMAIFADKIILKTKNLDLACVCDILKSHLSCILGAIKMLSNDLFEFVLSTDYLNFYTRIIMDLTIEIIREYWECAEEDTTQMGCSLKLSKALTALLSRHSSQPRTQNTHFYTIDKFKVENSCGNLDKIVINVMYKSDVNWPSYQCKEPEVVELLIGELVILHLNEIIQCVFSEINNINN